RGTNKAVADYVLSQPESQGFLDNVTNLIELVLPGYRREGKGFMTIAVGCTGGHHRSVAMSEALAKKLEGVSGINVNVVHRDIDRN
ncbi:MAG: RNase adapter RapZ, partial [Corynebacterium sp.]|nr:RNase adapter RapZ [Corynebacterium sp.]